MYDVDHPYHLFSLPWIIFLNYQSIILFHTRKKSLGICLKQIPRSFLTASALFV